MTEQQHSNFEHLLAAWRRHDDIRRGESSLTELADARFSLDRVRATTWSAFR